jgi:Domain of unknown function (DUF4126)
MFELLAVLSASAAVGMRIALPLLLIGLLYSDALWSKMPILAWVNPHIVLGILASWSLFEIFASKNRVGQRFLQSIQLVCSPIVGTIVGVAIARAVVQPGILVWLLGITGGLLAFVIQLVVTGWLYRLRQIPLWLFFAQDVLCVALVVSAFRAPSQGGILALLMLWLAIRSSKEWHDWYRLQRDPRSKGNPREDKQDPD